MGEAVRERTAPSAAEAIAAILRRRIIDDFADGELIGSAEDLADQFRVSSPTVRQAMRVLEAEGLVRVRRGNNGGFFAGTPSVDVVSRSASVYATRDARLARQQITASTLWWGFILTYIVGCLDGRTDSIPLCDSLPRFLTVNDATCQ